MSKTIQYASNQIARKDATRPKRTCYNEIRQIDGHLRTTTLIPLLLALWGRLVGHNFTTQCIL